jgi:hypothetical protein
MATLHGTITWRTRHGLDDFVSDTRIGGAENDTIRGFGGADHLFGRGGHDVIFGGRGNDVIEGGRGFDELTGGLGRDEFRFFQGDSGPSFNDADIIRDFNHVNDKITFVSGLSPAGTEDNYREFRIFDTGDHQDNYNLALDFARHDIGGEVQFAFYTDGKDGYLFADMDNNGTVDTGIELKGLDSKTDFSHLDIF